MQIAYWIVVAPLALLYLYAGGRKVAQSREQLRLMMGWVDAVPMPLVRSIGVVEIVGVVGLVLPPLTGVAPVLALVAALGFVALQVLAAGVHLSRGETHDIWLNVVLVVLAVLAAWFATAWLATAG